MTNKTIYGCAPFPSSIDNKYHYVYRITNLVEGKHYYGVRSSRVSPFNDLGVSYFGTPIRNSWIKQDQKDKPLHYKYKILKCFGTRKEANNLESEIHFRLNVRVSDKFYNGINASSKFDITGYTTVRDKVGNTMSVKVNDIRLRTGELVGIKKGMVPVIHKTTGKRLSISKEEYKNTVQYQHVSTGRIVMRNKSTGETRSFLKTDLIDHDVWEQITKNKILRKNISTGETRQFQREEAENLQKEWIHPATGFKQSKETIEKRKITSKYRVGAKASNIKSLCKTPWGIGGPQKWEPGIKRSNLNSICSNNTRKLSVEMYQLSSLLQQSFSLDDIGKTYAELGFSRIKIDSF